MEKRWIHPEQRDRIEADYERMCRLLARRPALPEELTETETICLKSLYAYIPVSDAVSYPVDFFVESVRDTLDAWEKVSWSADISAELFLCYVLPCRINNEDLSSYRKTLFDALYPRVKDCGLPEAALEANYWCFEKATYQSTDTRTLSPLGVMKNAYGRCGEESTFLTAALRSIGIPARQCYAPRWAHCDDNHAWVEYWDGKGWRFTGACEPEPVPDRGWFTAPAQRAMLIHARAFSGLVSEPGVTSAWPPLCEINILRHYTETRLLCVRVRDRNGRPLAGARVHFQLINFAELFSLMVLKTDKRGEASFETGLGDLYLHVSHGGRMLETKVDMRVQEGTLLLDWSASVRRPEGTEELDLTPPAPRPPEEEDISAEVLAIHKDKAARCVRIREQYQESFLRGAAAADFARRFSRDPFGGAHTQEIADLIAASNGNCEEIASFLMAGDDLEERVLLLQSLSIKDLSDVRSDVLEDHARHAAPYRSDWERSLYEPYVLCPRIHHERLTAFRALLLATLSDGQKAAVREDPANAFSMVEEMVSPADRFDYGTISAAPAALLEWKIGSALSKKILFVAILRTLGVPARLCPVDGAPEYWKQGAWRSPRRTQAEESACRLTLESAPGSPALSYGKNFTVARLKNGDYQTLGLQKEAEPGSAATYRLPAGDYRVTAVHRTAEGTILARLYEVALEDGDEKTLSVQIRADSGHTARELPGTVLIGAQGNSFPLSDFGHGARRAVAFIEPGGEPTEHLLNEMLEQEEAFRSCAYNILLVLDNEVAQGNPKLESVRSRLPVSVAFTRAGSFAEEAARLARAAGSPSGKYPLVLILDESARCIYHCAGYNVGTGDMLLRFMTPVSAP